MQRALSNRYYKCIEEPKRSLQLCHALLCNGAGDIPLAPGHEPPPAGDSQENHGDTKCFASLQNNAALTIM